jgi:ABC-2 type transport system ATP-binding protein
MIVYCSHVLDIVERVATDVLILQEGRVAAHGSVGDLRGILELPSLEQVFRRLVVASDVDNLARRLVEAMKV